MCTSGVISTGIGEIEAIGFKTLDGGPAIAWHGIFHQPGYLRAVGTGTAGRPGVNSGLNEAGAGIIVSYLDNYEASAGQADDEFTWKDDLRWIANGQALVKCTTAQELSDYLGEFFESNRSMGGNHLLFDESGTIIALEHQAGKVETKDCTEIGWTSRGNDNCILPDSIFESLSKEIHEDRLSRRTEMGIAAMKAHELLKAKELPAVIDVLKEGLSSHRGDGGTGNGSICAHGVLVPGGRSPSKEPYHTTTGIILDSRRRTMMYSEGNPCSAPWRTLKLDGE